MVVETRRRAGRGARKGRGSDNHQQLFRDHIKHRNEVRRFEQSLNGNQNVKIKQEKLDDTVGTKYSELVGTQAQGKIVNSNSEPKDIIEVVDDPGSEETNVDFNSVNRKGSTVLLGTGSTRENERHSTEIRGAKRSRNYYKDIREFMQNETPLTQEGDMFHWETIENDSEYSTNVQDGTENSSSVLETAMESIAIDMEGKTNLAVDHELDSMSKIEDTSMERALEDDQMTVESTDEDSYSNSTIDRSGKVVKTVVDTDESQQSNKYEKDSTEFINGESSIMNGSLNETGERMTAEAGASKDTSDDFLFDSEMVDDSSDEETVKFSNKNKGIVENKRRTITEETEIKPTTKLPSTTMKKNSETNANKNFDTKFYPDTSKKKKKVVFDKVVRTKTYSVLSESETNENTMKDTIHYSTNRYQSQIKGNSYQFNLIAKAMPRNFDLMKERGLSMVEEKTMLSTPVKVEFNMERTVNEFNVREHTIKLVDNMKIVDRALKINSTNSETKEWETTATLPENEEFNNYFQVREFTYRKVRKVLVHLKLVTSVPVNKIKYTNPVKEYIFQNNIWIKTDHFNTKIESSPGILTMINPKLINRDAYHQELKVDLEKARQKMVQMETSEGQINKTGEGQDSSVHGNERLIPQFQLEASVKKWGGINVEVLRINSAKEDAEYLKHLFSIGSEHGTFKRGLFVPAGLHLLEGKEVVSNILLEHDSYIQQSVGIPVTGLTQTEMNNNMDDESSPQEILLQIPGVESVEKSRDFQYTGQWLVITSKKYEKKVEKEIGTNLHKLYHRQPGQAKLILIGITQINGGSQPTNKVATYAEILSQRYVRKTSQDEESNKPEELAKEMDSATPRVSINKGVPLSLNRVKDGHTTTLSNKSKTQDEKNDHLHKKILQMEETQARLLEAQREIQRAQKTKEEKHSEIDKLEELTKSQEKFEEKMEHKLLEFQQEQKHLITESSNSIKEDLTETWNSKMDNISVIVANQVASQLVQIVRQYMLQERGEGANINMTPLINSEVHTEIPKITQGDTDTNTVGVRDIGEYNGSLDKTIKQATLTEITPNKSAIHDKFSEREKEKK